jgi:peptidoglycan/LPS O-acetylase OafA/YrhL
VRSRADHFPLFNGLRGLAALAVVLYHGLYQPATYERTGEWWWRYGVHLDVAVPVFLGISGFLLYHPYAAARARGSEPPSLPRYGLRRVLRIVPGYWFWLTVLALWFWAFPPGFEEVRSAEGVARFYGFAQIYDAETAIKGIGQAWTVDVEVSFYLAFPLWVLLARRFSLRAELIGLAALALASFAWKAWVLSRVDPADPASLSALLPLPTWLDHFAVGMALAAVAVRRPEGPRRIWPLWAGAIAFFMAAAWLAGPDGSPEDPVTDAVYLARHACFTGIVACLVAAAAWGRGGLLRWRPLAYAGLVSYSLYLVHTGVIRQQARWWGGPPEGTDGWVLWMLALTAASVALAAVGFHLVEKPFMRLGASRRRSEQLAHPVGDLQASSRSSAS